MGSNPTLSAIDLYPKGNLNTMKKLEFKNDKYRKARGGYSRFLNLSCTKCGSFVALYQKDGPGSLKRMYLDRILSPDSLVGLDRIGFKKLSLFTCQKCKQVLGVPFLYEKEDRSTFRLFEGSVSKKIAKIK